MHERIRNNAGAAAAAAGYALLSVLLTWPLVQRITTHVVGTDIDEGSFIWNHWWVPFALFKLGQSPFWTDYLFFPVGVNLATYTLTPLNALLAYPVQLIAGPIVANNVTLLASLTFAGLGGYVLARDVLQELAGDDALPADWRLWLGCFAAGIVCAYPASRFVYAALGQANFTSTAWLPWFAVFAGRTFRFSRAGLGARAIFTAIAAGLCFAGAALTELTFTLYLLLLIAALGVREAVCRVRAGVGRECLAGLGRLLVVLALVGAVGGTLTLPQAIPFLADRADSATPLTEAERFSADVLSFLIPTRLHPTLGVLSREWSADHRDIPIAFAGWATLAAALVGAVAWKRAAAFWLAVAAGFAVLALGPVMYIAGQSRFDIDGLVIRLPMPGILLHQLPLFSANRVPNRYSIMVALALAPVVGSAVYWLAGRLSARPFLRPLGAGAAVLVIGVMLFEHLSAPLPVRDAIPPSPYLRLAGQPGAATVLLLPLGWRNSFGIQGLEKTILQSYQWAHGQRFIGGNTSRNPPSSLAYFRRVPLLRSLISLEEGKPLEPGAADRDRALASNVANLLNIRYLAIDHRYTPPPVAQYALAALDTELIEQTAEVSVYRVRAALPAVRQRYDLGTPSGDALLANGWGDNEAGAGDVSLVWATNREVQLFLPAHTADAQATVRITPFVHAGMPPQRLTVLVNGAAVLTRQDLPAAWSELTFPLPAAARGVVINRVTFSFEQAASPADVAGSSDRRQLAAAVDWIEVSGRP